MLGFAGDGDAPSNREMTHSMIDHVKHGWALLALRLPEFRVLSAAAPEMGELLECYSLANLHLEKHRREHDSEEVESYEELRLGIEAEARSYLQQSHRMAG
ncbi:hypothetical protein J2W42_006721 [Rhizobium tibeticum]|uniref:Uncharacterized protein n=1 Tax=Rhizobium tibeticum TaxID=501024 RepID=A0A1H8VFD6_9HYPH|nr:hypothetical protein [Rhizobium tibeticum]SEI18647.1 hypothetical protein RTCCBAU85039_5955 [Rhizobium tibeticum]SEP13588.1 hypothetical protein SAMN05216228_104155 [Rhizobium tibeticum]